MFLQHKSRVRWFCLALVLSFTSATFAHDAQPRFVVFGDSLSDPGNFYFAYGQTSQAPFAPVPSAPYAISGHHFSNGPTWIEQLATALGTPESARPALARPGVNTNYAVGGARARANAPEFASYDLTTQVGLYLSNFQGHARPDAIHVVWIGGNDLRDALVALSVDPTAATSQAILGEAIHSVADNVGVLWATGARKFLIPNMPDLSVTPVIQSLGPQAVGATSQLIAAYNAGLAQAVAQLRQLPNVRIAVMDDFKLIDTIVARPRLFRFDDVVDPCLKFGVVEDAVCDQPREYLFWDGLHPTTQGHRIVALEALRVLVMSQ